MTLWTTMGRGRKLLLGATGLALVLLLALPATGWLVRSQLRLSVGAPVRAWQGAFGPVRGGDSEEGRWWNRQRAEAAARHRDDFGIQFAAALSGIDAANDTNDVATRLASLSARDVARQARLEALLPRFGDRPALRAVLLRFATQGLVMVRRNDEQNVLTGEPPPPLAKGWRPPAAQNAPETLAAFDAHAAAGERLDPNNAYFPLMRAVGLFAAHKDDEARAALLRAGDKPGWNDYLTDEADGLWRLSAAASGEEPGAVSRLALSAAILLPHCAQLRSVARLATVQAMTMEQAGQTEQAFALRRALARIGATMRVDGTFLITNLVGEAIRAIAGARPGGAPPLPDFVKGDERGRRIVDAYCAYLERIGHAEHARWYRAEAATRDQTRAVCADMMKSVAGGEPFWALLGWWAAGVLTLTNVVFVVLLGVGAAWLLRVSPRLRAGAPMTPAARTAIALGMLAPPLVLIAAKTPPEFGAPLVCGAVLLVLLGAMLALAGRHGGARAMGRALGLAFVTALVVAGAGMLAANVAAGPQSPLYACRQFSDWFSGSDNPGPLGLNNDGALLFALQGAGMAVAVPALLIGALALVSRVVRVPVSVGVARGLRGLALPVACALLLLYANLVVKTVEQETRVRGELAESMRHEGRYLARLAGKPWPGPAGDTR